jgi:DNA-binding MarR family transcriptional regulator
MAETTARGRASTKVSTKRKTSRAGLDRVAGAQSAPTDDVILLPLNDLLQADIFTPRLIALISNALVWRESLLLRRDFNLGTNDWRVISAVAIRPGSTSTDISESVALNKAVVSKAANTLIARKLIVTMEGPRGSRPLYLTQAGAEMHDAMKPISLRGEEIVLGDLSTEEIAQLTELLTRLLLKTPDLTSGL